MSNPIVLIAEEDADTREVLRNLLEPHGYDVVGAEDAMLACGLLSTVDPAVIIVDIMMPVVDGIGLIRWIRAREGHAETPIIAMSGYGEQHLREAMEVGANTIAKKPENIPNLPSMVHRFLGRNKRDRSGSPEDSWGNSLTAN